MDDPALDRFTSEALAAISTVAVGINAQLDILEFYGHTTKGSVVVDPYFPLYLFGAFDAVAMSWGHQIRKRIGWGLIELAMIDYLQAEFGIPKEAATGLHKLASDSHLQEPTNSAIVEGGTDGVQLLTGAPPRFLLAHFNFNKDEQVASEELRKFQNFLQLKRAERRSKGSRWS